MSHITHLYQLSAADFINFNNSIVNMAPWLPSYTAADMLDGGVTPGSTLILHYVTALNMRRKMHTASALFSGRHPIQNAIVPGGVTTLWHATTPANASTGTYDKFGPFNATESKTKFVSLLNEVRGFINTQYIPDVVTVANQFSQFWHAGTGCTNLLSYGDFPTDNAGALFLKRGISTGALSLAAFSQANVREYVDYSWYNYGALDAKDLHPFDGKTIPNMTTATSSGKYSWLKAPRLGTTTYEVGPLARMINTYLSTSQQNTGETDLVSASRLATYVMASAGALATYNCKQLVDTALSLCTSGLGESGADLVGNLFSPLGRHAARALEAKYLADAMADWVDQLNTTSSCYTYAKIPKQISTGYGLAEAPRGALGHWIKIEGKKVAKYQCVVPSTWNFSPKIGTAISQHGAVEQSLIGTVIGAAPGNTVAERSTQIVNILRVVHPFDCCIACAVHVVNPEGKEVMKFAVGPDGKPTNIEIAE